MSEFDLIQRYFTRATPSAELGVGDDAALLKVSEGVELVISTDMLVSATHFFPDADPEYLGHKTLAVNLSDLAAMGAVPRWATLALALPHVDEDWLAKFSRGFFALAEQHSVDLIGGDTTRGPLTLSVTIMGELPKGSALRRDAAQEGDDVWVSGALGDAALALTHLLGKLVLPPEILAACEPRLHQPQARVALGLALRGIANSAVDVSDGLLADLGHILERSHVAAELSFATIPRSAHFLASGANDLLLQHCALAGGDDYELCFTAAIERRSEIEQISAQLALPLTRIGKIVSGVGCVLRDADGSEMQTKEFGYAHFS